MQSDLTPTLILLGMIKPSTRGKFIREDFISKARLNL